MITRNNHRPWVTVSLLLRLRAGISKVKDGDSRCKYVSEVDDGNNYGELIVRDDNDEEFHW